MNSTADWPDRRRPALPDPTALFDLDQTQAIPRFVTSLGIGLLMGLERERAPQNKAGLRTFGLVALLGHGSALLAAWGSASWLLPTALLALGLMMTVAYRNVARDEDPGTTTIVALLLCFVLGALGALGHLQIAVSTGLVATSLLYFKTELHGVTARLSRTDWISLLQFAIVTFVILPLLPDQAYGPYGALNPYRIWLMVVLVSGIGLAGYVLLRLVGAQRALPLVGVLGGLVSSTATTLAFARHARRDAAMEDRALLVILTANLTVLLRISFMAAVAAPDLFAPIAGIMAPAFATGLVAPLLAWRQLSRNADTPRLEIANPTELHVVLGFAALYAAVLVGTQWFHGVAGAIGYYAAATVLGLTDMDAITLSSFRMVETAQLLAGEAVRAIALAYLANEVLKLGIVAVMGTRALALRVALGYAAVLAGLGVGVALLAR